MLIDTITQYCNQAYTANPGQHCANCSHPAGTCSGGCEACLEQVHYPKNGHRMDYNCPKMINFYVCRYTYKYASEIRYLLSLSLSLAQINHYNILSIGCGAAPDLMAFEELAMSSMPQKSISYIGIDKNNLWSDVHQKIKEYANTSIQGIKAQFYCCDAIEHLKNNPLKGANVISLQYVISHFQNTGQDREIDTFFDALIHNVISQKDPGVPLVILINDVNSCNRERESHMRLATKLNQNLFRIKTTQMHFNHRIQHSGQLYGQQHPSNALLYPIPNGFEAYNPWTDCSGAQLLIEVM